MYKGNNPRHDCSARSDTVYLAGELQYKYVYKTDTIYNDVP